MLVRNRREMPMLVHAVIRAAGAAEPSEPPAHPAGFYVGPGGNNANPGTFEQPWATIGFALTRLSPGDHLWLRGGTYRQAPLVSSISGTSGNPVSIHSMPGIQMPRQKGPQHQQL